MAKRYQRVNQNLYIKEEQTTQWPKENKQQSTKHTYKTKDRVTRTPLKIRGELRCSRGVSSSCSTGVRSSNVSEKKTAAKVIYMYIILLSLWLLSTGNLNTLDSWQDWLNNSLMIKVMWPVYLWCITSLQNCWIDKYCTLYNKFGLCTNGTWYCDTKVVSSNPAHGEVYSIQHHVIKFVSDLRQVGDFLQVFRFHPPRKLTAII